MHRSLPSRANTGQHPGPKALLALNEVAHLRTTVQRESGGSPGGTPAPIGLGVWVGKQVKGKLDKARAALRAQQQRPLGGSLGRGLCRLPRPHMRFPASLSLPFTVFCEVLSPYSWPGPPRCALNSALGRECPCLSLG